MNVETKGEVRLFSLSVAGHGEIYKDQSEGTILKGLQPPPNGEREVRFYQEVRLFMVFPVFFSFYDLSPSKKQYETV